MNSTSNKENYLVISAMGSDQTGIVHELAKASADNNCNIIDSRMTVLGGEFAVIMMVSGSWNDIAKLENVIPALAKKLDLKTIIKHTQPRQPKQAICYTVNVVALDNPGIVHEISNFFSEQNINIDDLQTGTYSAPHTGTQMFNLNMAITIPSDTHLATLREEFMVFCDDLNLDAAIEPTRNA